MWHLFQAVQPQRQEADLAAMWPLLLLRVHAAALQAPNDKVPLRQDLASPDAREPSGQLSGAHRTTHGRPEQQFPG